MKLREPLDIADSEQIMTSKHCFAIELAGLPRAGKTLANDALVHYLRSRGCAVDEYNGGSRTVPGYINKDNLSHINLYLLSTIVGSLLIQPLPLANDRRRMQLFDRGIVDRLVFTEALHAVGYASREQLEMARAAVSLPELTGRIDLVMVLTASPNAALTREREAKFVVSSGRVMRIDFLQALYDATQNLLSNPPPPCVQTMIHVDTTDMAPDEIVSCIRVIVVPVLSDLLT